MYPAGGVAPLDGAISRLSVVARAEPEVAEARRTKSAGQRGSHLSLRVRSRFQRTIRTG